MDTESYKVDISFCLKPHWKTIAPLAKIRLDSELIWDGYVEDVKKFELQRYLQKGNHNLEIEFDKKTDLDSDQQLEILDLRLGRIQSPRFVWQGVYRPQYSEPWATQQKTLGVHLRAELQNIECLGWNGIWCLSFSCPIFTWIHQIENLGWIYH